MAGKVQKGKQTAMWMCKMKTKSYQDKRNREEDYNFKNSKKYKEARK